MILELQLTTQMYVCKFKGVLQHVSRKVAHTIGP